MAIFIYLKARYTHAFKSGSFFLTFSLKEFGGHKLLIFKTEN